MLLSLTSHKTLGKSVTTARHSVLMSEENEPRELQGHSQLLQCQPKPFHVPQTSLDRWACPTRAHRRPCLLLLGQSTTEPGPRVPSCLPYRTGPHPTASPRPAASSQELKAAEVRSSEEAAETSRPAVWNRVEFRKEAVGVSSGGRLSLRMETGDRARCQVRDRCPGDPLRLQTGCKEPLLRAPNPPMWQGPHTRT